MMRNLDNVVGGNPSPLFSFKTDAKTREIFAILKKHGINRSEFIRNAILELYETTILGDKK